MGFCDSSTSSGSQYGWQNPLGPTSMSGGHPTFSATGAPQMAQGLFSYLGGDLPAMTQAGQKTASGLDAAAGNAGWGQETGLARNELTGDYLAGSPQLNRALASNQAQAISAAQNENARIRGQYAKSGMDYSTGAQEAAQANTAAAGAQAQATNSQSYLQNYLAERQAQQNAGSLLAQGTGGPLNYLSQVSGAYSQPLSQAGNLLSGLSGGGGVYQTGGGTTSSPSMASDIMNGMTMGGKMQC